MSFLTAVPWIAVGGIGAGVATLALVAYLWRHRGKAGANWFMLALLAQAVWCFAYGGGLLVYDPGLREAFEVVGWLGIVGLGVLFLAFALEYTGRGHLCRNWAFGLLAVVPVAVLLTSPFHTLVWRDFRVEPALGMAVADYAIQPLGYLLLAVEMVYVGVGVLLLVEAILSYGPLYRREALAVALSTVPPSIGHVAWLFGASPVPNLNFAVVLFLPHVALDAYAFVGTNMFESNPTTRRVAEQQAIDTVPDPVLVLDPGYRVIERNAAATRLFETPGDGPLEAPITAVVGDEFDPEDPPRYVTFHDGGRTREYRVSITPLVDPRDETVGHTVVFRDVTEEREREQRLEVLNRVLRHNLRNQLTVVQGAAEFIGDRVDDDGLDRSAALIEDSTEDLMGIAEKARAFDQLRDSDPSVEPVDVDALLSAVTAEFADRYPDATVDTELAVSGTVHSDDRFLRVALENLVENALEHADGDAPRVRVSVDRRGRDGETLVVTVSDDGPGIPEAELAPLRRGEEGDLEHGSGLGLWVVRWSVDRLGGDLRFDTDGSGTAVSMVLPVEPDTRDGETPERSATASP